MRKDLNLPILLNLLLKINNKIITIRVSNKTTPTGIETPLNICENRNKFKILFKHLIKYTYRIMGRFELGIGSGMSTQHSVLSLQQ